MGDCFRRDLPDGWLPTSLDQLAILVMGQSPPSSTYNDEGKGLPFLQGKAEFGDITPTTVKFCSKPLKIAPPNSVLVSVRAPVGDVNITAQECCIGRGLAAIHPRNNVDIWFLFASMLHYKSQLESRSSGTTFKSINTHALRTLLLPLPPLSVQQAIAHVLRTVQQAKEATEKVIAALQKLKQSMMRHLFKYGPVPFDKRDTVHLNSIEDRVVPRHWRRGRFDDFAVLQRGFDITKADQECGNIPVVSSSGISSFHNIARVRGPGAIIGRKGSLGTVHFVETDYWPHDTTLWVKDFKGNNAHFIYYLLQTMQLQRLDTGTSNPTLNRNYVHPLQVAIPKLREQEQIVAVLDAVDQQAKVLNSRNVALRAIFSSTLHELMTGARRIPSPSISSSNSNAHRC